MASDSTAGGAPAEPPVDAAPASNPANDPGLPPTGEPSPGELAQLVEKLQAEKADLHDKHLRAVAESHNIRRRAQQDVERERKFGIERFAKDMVSVADNLGRALSALPADRETLDPAQRNVITGVEATSRELLSALERHGVTRIESLGKPFSAEVHQAMMEIEDTTVPAGTVVQELIPGYLIAGRLLRAAMVAVSKGGPARTDTPTETRSET